MANTPPLIPGLTPIGSGAKGVTSQSAGAGQVQLATGSIIQGSVVGLDAKGNVIMQGKNLQLVLDTKFPLPKGAQVSVRIDAPVTRDALPSIRILSVDGTPPQLARPSVSTSGLTQQLPLSGQPTSTANTPLPPQSNSAAAEAAKPVGLLLEVMTRGDGAAIKTAAPALAAALSPTLARGVAAEVQLTESSLLQAVLTRPATTAKALQLVQQFLPPAPVAGSTPPASPLRPGLQLQIRLIPAPLALQSSLATGLPATGAASPQPSAPLPPVMPMAIAPTTPYAAGGIASATVPSLQGGALPPAIPPTVPLSGAALPPAVMPASGVLQEALLSTALPLPAATPAPSGDAASPMQAATVPTSSAATPAPQSQNTPLPLTPQRVEQLLQRAEGFIAPQGQMAAVVLAKEPSGAVTVQTRMGVFTLPQPPNTPVQPGNVMIWQVSQALPPAAQSMPLPLGGAGSALAAASQFTAEWSALQEVSSLLHGLQSSMAAQTLQRMVPHTGGGFSAGLLFFMSVLRKGDLSDWMGKDMMQQLERMGKGDTLQRLTADFVAIRSVFAEPSPSGWQALFFPVMVDKQLEQAKLYIKEDEQHKKQGGNNTRFIVELELSHFGAMQMDGLVKRHKQKSHFDLVIRSLQELPEQVKSDIYGIFTHAQKLTGLEGSLNFRRVQDFPVQPMEEIQRGKKGGGSILA